MVCSRELSFHFRNGTPPDLDWSYPTFKNDALTFTKTLQSWDKAHSEWQARATETQEALKQLPQAELRQCLGKDYEMIMDLSDVKLHSQPSTIPHFEPSDKNYDDHSGDLSSQVIPQKRFID